MTKEYLKMADSLVGEVFIDSGCLLSKALGEIADFSGYNKECRYIAHAINSHDELVAEVERLRESNKRMAKAIWSKWEREGIFTHNSEGQADIFRELYLCDPSSDSATE